MTSHPSATSLRLLLGAAALSALPALPGARGAGPTPAPPRRSVLLLIIDGLGTPDGYGRDVKTPNLDRLAGLGRRFERAYSQYPQGRPSRASFLSGWRPESTLVWRDKASLRAHGKALVPLQKHFRAHDYFVARVGEIYGGQPESEMSWDLVAEPPAKGGGAEWAAARTAQILAEKSAGLLFLAAGLGRPPNGTLPDKFTSLHKPAQIRLSAGAAERPGPLPAIALPDRPDRVGRPGGSERPPAPTEERLRQDRAAYYAYVAWLDAQIGILLETLDRLKLWDSTAVVLVGDCAPYLGGHGALKRSDVLFEETLRTPLLVVAPGLGQPGTPTTQLVELVDVYPTLVELAGLPAVRGVEGTSLTPMLADPERPLKTAVFSVLRRVAGQLGRSVRTERYRYTEWPDGNEELYDHQDDPGEFTNLTLRPEHAGTVAELKKVLGTAENPPATQNVAASLPRGGKKPNVLLIVADDMNARLGCYGYDVATPNMDRLARIGRRFDRAYCQVAMCSPSRTSFLTGRRPERLAIWDNLEPPLPRLQGAVPIQEHFKAHGYFTARVGKIFHQSFDPGFQWDVAEHAPQSSEQEHEEEEAPEPRRQKRRGETDLASWSVPTERPDDQEPDGLRARRVAQLIEQHKDRPFFIALGFAKPHLRWVAPRKYFELYPPQKIRVIEEPPDDWLDVPLIAIEHDALDHPGRFLSGPLQPGDQRREGLAGYSAAVSFVDAQLGVVLDALDRLKLWDDTIVVATGDHGFQLGEHGGLWRKDTLFEEALRVPLLVWAPGLGRPGVATSSLAELVDLYPTLTDLAGLPRPKDLDGTSLAPLLEDPTRSVKSAAFSAARRRPPQLGWSVRTERYRYTEWPDGSRELYDHQTDPGERANLADLPAHAQTAGELRKRLHEGWSAAVIRR